MTRFIDLASVKKMDALRDTNKQNKHAVEVKAVAQVNGKEQVGVVVYRRKAVYGAPFQTRY